jgi:hypothetical protein
LNNVQASQAGDYLAVVSNSVGAVTSAVARLTVLVPPAITAQPVSLTVTQGQTANFSVSASGTAPLSYQWRRDGVNLDGATTANHTIAAAQTNDAGSFTVVVSNSAGSVTSAVASLTVLAAGIGPAITEQPQSQTVAVSNSVSFTVGASGTAPLFYEWREGGMPIAGGTNATLTIPSVTTNDAGAYTAVVSNSFGVAVSTAATLTVTEPPPAPWLAVSYPAPAILRISLTAVPGQVYQLEGRQSLTEGAWTPSGPAVTNHSSVVSWELPLEDAGRFFRVSLR